MRLVTFKNLKGKNFLSIGDNEVAVDLRPGVNAIVGTNHDKEDSKNGAGKSTITELLYYALYGNTLREISKDHIQNSITKKRCEVSLEFDVISNNSRDAYKIVRQLNPTKCQLFKNEEDITRSTLAKTNNLIQQLIRTPSTVFQNSVIMSANNALPFMALSKTDKRKFIESVLGLEVFTEMVLKARDDYSIAKKDYEIAYTRLEQQQNDLVFNQSQYENYEKTKNERLCKLQTKNDTIEKDIQILVSKLSNTYCQDLSCSAEQIQLHKQSLEDQQKKLRKIQEGIVKTETEINSERKQIKNLQTNKDSCPTCSREYSEQHVKHVQLLIAKHESTILKYEEVLQKLLTSKKETQILIEDFNQKVKEQEKQKELAEAKVSENKQLQTSLSFLKQHLKEVAEEILIAKKEHNNDLKGKLSALKQDVSTSQQTVDTLNNELNILETVKFVISEEGIKSFIVKKVLKVLNSRLAYYLEKLQANCLCQFNEFFDEVIVDENGHQKSYFNFSGGERKRIDLSILFAFADIRRLQGDVNFNTVFYDELLDSSLDDKGVQLTLRVLRERFIENNEACYIITHRGPEVLCKAEHVISVIKKNGLTTLCQTH